MLQFIREIVPRSATIADIGSGTGILTRQLLNAGYEVYAIERTARCVRSRAVDERRTALSQRTGSAESTSLPDQSIEFITSAQLFILVRPCESKVEFRRILRPFKMVALIWNDRQADASTFGWKYEEL